LLQLFLLFLLFLLLLLQLLTIKLSAVGMDYTVQELINTDVGEAEYDFQPILDHHRSTKRLN
jgi:hypothetical protein